MNYRKAVNTLKPNAARMAAIHAKQEEVTRQAKIVVREMLEMGCDPRFSYKIACKTHRPGETELEREIRVILLGVLRRGDAALK